MVTFYDEAFKQECIRLVVKEGRTITSVQREFNLGQGTLNNCLKQSYTSQSTAEKQVEADFRQMQQELKELKKENEFLKK